MSLAERHSTTVLCVRRGRQVAMGSDGQVTVGETIMKGNARKVRKLKGGNAMAGFAGGSADALTLFELFENQLEKHGGQLLRAAVELAREWRTHKILRRLEAMLCVADAERSLVISGGGDLIEPERDVVAIGSGGGYALAAARALLEHTSLPPVELVTTALGIAADICIYTNHETHVEQLGE